MERTRSVRSSIRSRDSSSTRSSDPRERVKDCCRKLVAFMCTQVGVGGLVVGYTIVGAFGFMYIETLHEYRDLLEVELKRNSCASELWKVTSELNVLNVSAWRDEVDSTLRVFQDAVVNSSRRGYNGKTVEEMWTFPAALMFSLSIITMIGYGNMVPKTDWGKGVTVIYAVIGIPLYILYFMNMGKVLAQTFRWLYTKMYRCTTEPRRGDDDDLPEAPRRVIVPSTACLWVISGYVLTGTIMFAEWEGWDYLDSTYFCVTSLCKIGMGDYVPGANIRESKGGDQTKLVINFVYMLLGMGLVAMCYNLMREEVKVKMNELREDLVGFIFGARCLNRIVRTAFRGVALVGGMLGFPTAPCPVRLCGIQGYDARINDIVYCYPTARADHQTAVVFFGGDIQDFTENMESHRDSKNYLKWNLESTALILQSYFPDCHIVVVRPSRYTTPKLATFMDYVRAEMDYFRMEFKTFSCFDNFVPCNNCGAPDHTPTHFALQHLEKLLQGVSHRLKTMPDTELLAAMDRQSTQQNSTVQEDVPDQVTSEDPDLALSDRPEKLTVDVSNFWWRDNLNLDKANLILLGFSKGCVVLNQFIYEFHYLKTLTPDDETMMRLVSRIQDMYWLDGGHAGGKNTWITSRSLLETLTRLGISIHIHVTPYQVQDERRPWIRKEEKVFNELLRRLGATVYRTLHFENQHANLYTHFDVLTVFKEASAGILK